MIPVGIPVVESREGMLVKPANLVPHGVVLRSNKVPVTAGTAMLIWWEGDADPPYLILCTSVNMNHKSGKVKSPELFFGKIPGGDYCKALSCKLLERKKQGEILDHFPLGQAGDGGAWIVRLTAAVEGMSGVMRWCGTFGIDRVPAAGINRGSGVSPWGLGWVWVV